MHPAAPDSITQKLKSALQLYLNHIHAHNMQKDYGQMSQTWYYYFRRKQDSAKEVLKWHVRKNVNASALNRLI